MSKRWSEVVSRCVVLCLDVGVDNSTRICVGYSRRVDNRVKARQPPTCVDAASSRPGALTVTHTRRSWRPSPPGTPLWRSSHYARPRPLCAAAPHSHLPSCPSSHQTAELRLSLPPHSLCVCASSKCWLCQMRLACSWCLHKYIALPGSPPSVSPY